MKTFSKITTLILLLTTVTITHAVTFDAYKNILESEVLCTNYAKLKPIMHYQMLKETVKLSSNTFQNGKENKYILLETQQLFGYDLKNVILTSTKKNQSISVTIAGDTTKIVKQLNSQIEKNFGEKVQNFQPNVYYWNNPEKHDYELHISKINQNDTQITCGPFLP